MVVVAALVVAAPVAAGSDGPIDSGVLDVEVTGPGAATVEDGTQFVWGGERTDFVAEVGDYVNESDSYYETYYVRLTRNPDENFSAGHGESLALREVTLAELQTKDVTLSVPPGELRQGPRRLYVAMYEPRPGYEKRVNVTHVDVRVVWKGGDVDGDDLRNLEEVQRGTQLLDPDTDGDDLTDGNEVYVFGSDPTLRDTDGDGVLDPHEVRNGSNPDAADTDEDDLGDDSELGNASSATAPDSDLDGLSDPVERRLGTDPTDRDTDGDGLSDGTEYHETGTDPLAVDTDGDGLDDAAEVRRFGTDPTDADTDGDGVADGREVLRGTDPAGTDRAAPDDSAESVQHRDPVRVPLGPFDVLGELLEGLT